MKKLKTKTYYLLDDEKKRYSSIGNTQYVSTYLGGSPYRPYHGTWTSQTILTAIFNRIAVDCAAIPFRHVHRDNKTNVITDIKWQSNLMELFTVSANIDQTGRAFIQDVIYTLLERGTVAVIPVRTSQNIDTGSYTIQELRTGIINEYSYEYITCDVFNAKTGTRQPVTIKKENCLILENPFYTVMNDYNTVLRNLINKYVLLDSKNTDPSGSIDVIVQRPFGVNNNRMKADAEANQELINSQMQTSKYGFLFIDSNDKITQLNRAANNTLQPQIDALIKTLYSQLSISETILSGTADEQELLNYYTNTIEPILALVGDEIKRKFLTKTARTQGQDTVFVRNMFKTIPISQLADVSDKLIRSTILTPNEFRPIIGYEPSENPRADELRNPNINENNATIEESTTTEVSQNGNEPVVENSSEYIIPEHLL